MSVYELYEIILIPIAAFAIVWLVSLGMYLFARRCGKPLKGETMQSKLYKVQSVSSAILLGQIAGHTVIFTDTFALTYGYLFVLLGIVALRHAESLGRAWNSNRNVIPVEPGSTGDFDVNPETMETESYVSMTNLSSPETATALWEAEDRRKTHAKRKWMFLTVLTSLSVIAVMNGFLMVYRVPSHLKLFIMGSFLSNIGAQTVAMAGTMIYAGFHIRENRKTRLLWWTGVTLIWSLVASCTTFPIWAGWTPEFTGSVLNTPYVACTYLFFTGVLWRTTYYYEKNLYSCQTRVELFWDALIYTASLAASATVGFWL